MAWVHCRDTTPLALLALCLSELTLVNPEHQHLTCPLTFPLPVSLPGKKTEYSGEHSLSGGAELIGSFQMHISLSLGPQPGVYLFI